MSRFGLLSCGCWCEVGFDQGLARHIPLSKTSLPPLDHPAIGLHGLAGPRGLAPLVC